MANKKKILISLVLRETEVKIIMRFYYISVTMAKLKRLTIPSVGEDIDELLLSCNADENIKWYNPFGKWFGSD